MAKLNNIVMFACNQGGHFSQMMALRQLFGKYNSVLVTDNVHATKEKTPALKDISAVEYAMGMAKQRKILQEKGTSEKNRMHSIVGYFSLFAESYKIWKKYRPAVIITTGSNIAVGLFLYGWLKGSKLIFIETRAKVYSKTVTGRIVSKVADKIFVQWPEMKKIYPKAEYCGTLV